MNDMLWIVTLALVWVVLQVFILPRLGVPT